MSFGGTHIASTLGTRRSVRVRHDGGAFWLPQPFDIATTGGGRPRPSTYRSTFRIPDGSEAVRATRVSRAAPGPFCCGRCASAGGLQRSRYRVFLGRAVALIQSEPSRMRVVNRTLPIDE